MKIRLNENGINALKSRVVKAGLEVNKLAALVHVSPSTLLDAMEGRDIRPSSYTRIRDYFFAQNPDSLDNYATVSTLYMGRHYPKFF